MGEAATRYFHAFVPHKHRLMMLVGFIRSHLTDSIVVACAGANIAEYLSILTNNFELRSNAAELNILVSTPSPNSSSVKGRQGRSERTEAIDRLNSGAIKVLFGSSFILSNMKLMMRPTWLIDFDLPNPAVEELKLIQAVNPQKFLLLLDSQHAGYLGLLEGVKVTTQAIPFDEKKLPKLGHNVLSLCKKNYPLYHSSQLGYRELINSYVNHDNADLFDARKLPLLDLAINFGIEALPLLPLTK
jgi:superfamily II DNA/RNA helicase